MEKSLGATLLLTFWKLLQQEEKVIARVAKTGMTLYAFPSYCKAPLVFLVQPQGQREQREQKWAPFPQKHLRPQIQT